MTGTDEASAYLTIIKRLNGHELELKGTLLEVTRGDGTTTVALNFAEFSGEAAGADVRLRHLRDYVDTTLPVMSESAVSVAAIVRVVRSFEEIAK